MNAFRAWVTTADVMAEKYSKPPTPVDFAGAKSSIRDTELVDSPCATRTESLAFGWMTPFPCVGWMKFKGVAQEILCRDHFAVESQQVAL